MTQYRELHFNSADGAVPLYARDYPAALHAGLPLLMMHGLTRNSADFEPLAAHLAGRHRMIVPDQRGRGRSGWDDDVSRYNPAVYAADMIALLDAQGIDRCVLIGTSMGGLMAMIMAATQPQRFAGIIFNDIGPFVEPEGLARIQSYVGGGDAVRTWDDAATYAARINGSAFPDFTDADWAAFARRIFHEDADGALSLAYDPAISAGVSGENATVVPPDLWPLWDMLDSVPMLILRGAISDLLSAATVSEMTARHSGPVSAVEVPRRGHAPLLDEAEALSAITAFLRDHAAA